MPGVFSSLLLKGVPVSWEIGLRAEQPLVVQMLLTGFPPRLLGHQSIPVLARLRQCSFRRHVTFLRSIAFRLGWLVCFPRICSRSCATQAELRNASDSHTFGEPSTPQPFPVLKGGMPVEPLASWLRCSVYQMYWSIGCCLQQDTSGLSLVHSVLSF